MPCEEILGGTAQAALAAPFAPFAPVADKDDILAADADVVASRFGPPKGRPPHVELYSTVVLAAPSYLDGVAAVHAAIQASATRDYPRSLGATASALKSPRCRVGDDQFLVTFKAQHRALAEPGFGDLALSVAVNLFADGVVEFQRRFGCSCQFVAFYRNVLGALRVDHAPLCPK